MEIKNAKPQSDRTELHERILAVTIKMFHEQGIRSVRMDDIASHLSISKRTLYEMFQDKEELLLECVKRKRDYKREYLKEHTCPQDNVLKVMMTFFQCHLQEIRHINPRFFEEMGMYPRVTEYLARERSKDFDSVVSYFEKGREQGIFRPEVDMKLFIGLLNLTLDKAMESNLSKEYPADLIFGAVIFTYLRGISTEKGQKILNEYELTMQPDLND